MRSTGREGDAESLINIILIGLKFLLRLACSDL